MKENRNGTYTDGRYVSQGCSNCKFWAEQRREGVCSQKIKTTDGVLVKRVTFHDEVCSQHEDDDIKTYFNFYIKENGDVAINGTYSRNKLLKMKEYLEELMKDS